MRRMMRDIARREQAVGAVRESEERFRSIFEQAAIGVAQVAPDGRWLCVNQRLCDIVGYAREELLEMAVQDITCADDLPAHLESVRRILARESPTCSTENRYIRRDGSLTWINLILSLVRDPAGEPKYFIAVVEEIDDRKWEDEQSRHAQKLEMMGTLTGGVAHDFSNLLMVISGYTTLIRRSLPPNAQRRRYLKAIEQAIQQATGVTRALMTFSHKMVAEKSPFDLGKNLTDSMRLLRRVLPAAVEIIVDVPSGLNAWVNGDAIQIQQVLLNLVVNARDAMPEGGQLRIALCREQADPGAPGPPSAVLLVEDTGTGMSAKILPRIFEPSFATKPRGHGTGLGMSVVHWIIADHRGQFDVDSKPGGGTQFTIRLPLCDPPEAAFGQGPDVCEECGRGELILVVEDDAHIRSLLRSTLRLEGYEVLLAADGIEALAALRAQDGRIRLLMLDLDLPRLDGLACLREVRKTRPDLPAIIVTGSLQFGPDQLPGHKVELLRKPFLLSELLGAVARALRTPPEKMENPL